MDGQRAISDLNGQCLALAQPSSCRDCQVQVRLQAYGVHEAGVVLRARGESHYALVFLNTRRIQLRRYEGTRYTVLGEASSGRASAWEPVTLTLAAQGSGPVELTASVEGQVRLVVTDSSASALVAPGFAGLATPIAGVWFDDFQVRPLPDGDSAPAGSLEAP
jgi:hypothetical protein